MLDLAGDPIALTAALVDVESVSGDEAAAGRPRARGPQRARAPRPSCGTATTSSPAPSWAGSSGCCWPVTSTPCPPLTTSPATARATSCSAAAPRDMKSGDAVLLHLAATVTDPAYDVTFVLYDNEEVAAEKNGLNQVTAEPPRLAGRRPGDPDGADQRQRRGRLPGDAAGRRRPDRQARAQRPQLARRPTRSTPRHRCSEALSAYQARDVEIDGCVYREGLQAVRIDGGHAGNVVPDSCVRDGQLPLRARPLGRAGAAARGRGVPRATRSPWSTRARVRCPA